MRRTRSAGTCTRVRGRRLSFGALPTSQEERSRTGVGIPATLTTSSMSLTDAPTASHRYAELTWPEVAARLFMLERRDVIAATFWYLSTPRSLELLERTRDSDQPGGIAHACELETSLYLAIRPQLVQMDKAVREIPDWDSDTVWMDWTDGPLSVKGQWSGWTESGVIGDATVATAEKGRLWLERAVEEITEHIDELAKRAPRPGRDHHDGAVDALQTREGST